MAQSLLASETDCQLYIFAFDERCETALRAWNHPRVIVVSLSDFEHDDLLSVKASRTVSEYCWTCTSFVIDHCLRTDGLDHCTYIDADLFFFASPRPLLEEMGSRSILITPHRYTPEYDQSRTSGIYCVQFVTFKADSDGLHALAWWKEACLAWCFARVENGRFGDQKYLDDWPERFKGVHVLEHIGGGVAPWNVQQYRISSVGGKLHVHQGEGCWPLIFYHFHNMTVLSSGCVHFGCYRLTDGQKVLVYRPYCDQLMLNRKSLASLHPDIPLHSDVRDGLIRRLFDRSLKKRLRPPDNLCEIRYD